VPAWHSPRRRAPGKPHPGRGAVDWPKAACQAGGSGLEPPEPSTTHGRWPCPRPWLETQGGTTLPKRSRRRAKRRSGSVARA